MTLQEQAAARVALAREMGRKPTVWVATEAVARDISDESGNLIGLPVELGAPRSDWGLELRCAAAGDA